MATYIKGASQVSLVLQVLMASAFAWWWLFWFLQPIEKAKNWTRKVDPKMDSTFIGTRGSTFLLQILPFMVIAVVSFFVIELRKRIKPSQKTEDAHKKPKVSIWSQPIIVKSPLGMLTLADITFFVLNVGLIIWYFTKMSVDRAKLIDNTKQKKGAHSRSAQKLENIGVYLGKAALIPFALLWIPVSRASPILRVTGVPFERAVKYHIWLGQITVGILTVHGIVFFAYFPSIHHTSELWSWSPKGIAFFPGIIALSAGLIMLMTALERVRRNNFNLFFLAHHLYLVFFLFFLFHCQSQMVYVVIPILLFFLDRFMRTVQSRKSVDVLSTKVLSSGAIELKFAKPENLEYTALSFIYVLLPSISKFEWHPFSVASSPLDESNQICIYIKPLGSYTKDLHDALIDTKAHKEAGKLRCPFSFKVALEGPYGEESNFYVKYDTLVLVAGGIGVTPFLAILRDLLHRHRLQQADLPREVQLYFCVRNQQDLCLLDTLDANSILPDYGTRMKINVHAYITSKEVVKTDEETATSKDVTYEQFVYTHLMGAPELYYGPPLEVVRDMSILSGTGQSIWVGATVFATVMGYFIIWGILNVTFLDDMVTNYSRAILYCVTIALAVVGCGGGVMLVWSLHQRRLSANSRNERSSTHLQSMHTAPNGDKSAEGALETVSEHQHSPWEGDVTLGMRPNWKDLFAALAKQYEGKDVGVLVSGGQRMQEDLATECKRDSNKSGVAFHYHSVSFEL